MRPPSRGSRTSSMRAPGIRGSGFRAARANAAASAAAISKRVSEGRTTIFPIASRVTPPRRQSSGRSHFGSAFFSRPMEIRNHVVGPCAGRGFRSACGRGASRAAAAVSVSSSGAGSRDRSRRSSARASASASLPCARRRADDVRGHAVRHEAAKDRSGHDGSQNDPQACAHDNHATGGS